MSPAFLKYIVLGSILVIISVAYIGSSIISYGELLPARTMQCQESASPCLVMSKGWLDFTNPVTYIMLAFFAIGSLLIGLYFYEESKPAVQAT